MVTVLLIFGMIASAVSCGAQDVPQGVWTGQGLNGGALSVAFIGNRVYSSESENDDSFTFADAGTFTFEKNAGMCNFDNLDITVPFTIKGTSMNYGSNSATGFSITLTKDTKSRTPGGIGGIWSMQDESTVLAFINNIVYLEEKYEVEKFEYTYDKGSGSINIGGKWNNFTVSGSTLRLTTNYGAILAFTR
jgi:hypothetical protein